MLQYTLYLLFFLSGAAGLGYELIWTRMLSVVLGHEIVSVLAVVSAFFSGLALGAWSLDRPVSSSGAPGRWYAALELIIGIWALVLIIILPFLNPLVSQVIGVAPSVLRHWSISFAYPFTVLLPATMAMGGTLPAMDRLIEKHRNSCRTVAGLYSVNTLGALVGTFCVTFIILPALGMQWSTVCLASINFIGAAGVFALIDKKKYAPLAPPKASVPLNINRIYLVLLATGLAGIGFEVLIVRALSQVLENTIFSFAAMLMVFLLGTALGAAIYQKINRDDFFDKTLAVLLISTAFSCTLSIVLLQYVSPLFVFLQDLYGSGFIKAVTAELTITLLYFLLPTTVMGATFSHLAQSLKNSSGGVGRALCLNTIGGAMAPIIFGVLLLPMIGLKYAIFLIPGIYLLCLIGSSRTYALSGGALLAVLMVCAVMIGPYQWVTSDKDDTVIYHRDGVIASVSVTEDDKNQRHLKVNNHYQMGGTSTVFSDRRQGYLPLLLHANPHRALFLGLGAGTTFASAAVFQDLKATGVELVPEIIDALPLFEKATGDLCANPNLEMICADARRFVMATDETFDVVVADLFHPARDGAAALYTIEHFQAVRKLLRENGLFCQWLPLYQLDLETFKVITRTFLEVFPDGQAWLAHYSIDQPIIGLIGARKPLRFPEKWYRKRLPGKEARRHMAGFGYDSIYSLLGTFMADAAALKNFVSDSSINSDDRPVVLFDAPQFVYNAQEPAQTRLLALLNAFSSPDPESILAEVITEEDYMARSRLSNYWTARNGFLELGANIQRTRDVTRLYETTSAPLLNIVRESIDFSAAYFPLISIAYELYPYDREASRQLLQNLEKANPMRREAGVLRRKLFVN